MRRSVNKSENSFAGELVSTPAKQAMSARANREYPITVAAIDVGGTKVAGALVTYAGAGEPPTLSAQTSVPTEARKGGPQVLEKIVGLVARLADEAKASGVTLAGVGVGAAGVIDPASGNVRHAGGTMPGWSGLPLCTRLEEEFGLPVATLGDVQAHALGERPRNGLARAVNVRRPGVGVEHQEHGPRATKNFHRMGVHFVRRSRR